MSWFLISEGARKALSKHGGLQRWVSRVEGCRKYLCFSEEEYVRLN
jgi:hypothetical protein